MGVPSSRRLADASLARTKAFPHAGSTNYLDSYVDANSVLIYLPIDIGAPGPFRSENFSMELETMAAPSLADGQAITFTLLESDSEQGPYTATGPQIQVAIIGAGGQGAPAQNVGFSTPIGVKQFLIMQQTADAGSGDPSGDGWAELRLLI